MEFYGVRITGTGSYTPEKILTNKDLEKMVDTTDEWITTRTGIKERHIAASDESTSDMAVKAAVNALKVANLQAEQIDLILIPTLSPDNAFPNTGCHVQRKLGAKNAACFSIEAACSGFLYGLKIATDMIRCGSYKNILLVCAEKMSMHIDWEDRATCVLFGDGAGAVVLQACPEKENSILASKLGADGNYADLLIIPAGGSKQPITAQLLKEKKNFLHMSGREVFKLAVTAMAKTSEEVLSTANVQKKDIKWLVPHQANNRIIQAVGKRLKIEAERVYINVDRYGNTSAASIPIALDEMVKNNKLNKGDYILLTAFGGGLTWGSQLIRW